MVLADLTSLGAQLLIISATSKMLVDIMAPALKGTKHAKQAKVIASYLIPILIALGFDVSLFVTFNETLFYIGCVIAGAIAGLGATFIHEILKALQTLKELKKK